MLAAEIHPLGSPVHGIGERPPSVLTVHFTGQPFRQDIIRRCAGSWISRSRTVAVPTTVEIHEGLLRLPLRKGSWQGRNRSPESRPLSAQRVVGALLVHDAVLFLQPFPPIFQVFHQPKTTTRAGHPHFCSQLRPPINMFHAFACNPSDSASSRTPIPLPGVHPNWTTIQLRRVALTRFETLMT